ncbi:Hsp20/alpha crystallin family protein [Desulfohalobium retbaense]|uniref:Heat shock protein Hsp20 n=1 Tax=Desulfohalobium retbaense (strain ATCC 49708 / DSM 5692 / JCM 16813 / HR100) TaxID=485915 RepID=C8X0R4_DESRD|nr:Hsp20/alpha crystallin family protein [Desulfohalobium retbaense]ACV68011.1 heat shock protein Hsp20 [Desulfohalobium retbaense DSM 5692]
MVIDFSSFYDLPRSMEQLFDNFWQPSSFPQRRQAFPPLNISEDSENVYVRAEMPGLHVEDVDLTLTDNSLIIKGERVQEEGKYFRQERAAGVFQRLVNLNVPVQRDNISATMRNGILEIRLPKSEEIKPKKISIDVG